MASPESFDLYTCDVCLENMLDKNPRHLVCLHSFCHDCIKKIMKDSAILCPTCRRETTVPNNNVNQLTANFMLQKVKEHMDKMYLGQTTLCHLCRSESATLKCQECVQLLCEDCSHKHNKVTNFKDHKLHKLCPKHKEGIITNLCVKCAKPACANCVIKEHLDHEKDVETYEKGIETLKKKMTQYDIEIEVMLQSTDKSEKEHEIKLQLLKSAVTKVEDIKQYYLKKTQEADQMLNTLRQSELAGAKVKQNYDMKVQALQITKDFVKKRLGEIQNGVFDSCTGVTMKLEQIKSDQKYDTSYHLPDVQIDDPHTGKIFTLTRHMEDVYLEKPVFVKETDCPENGKWQETWNISNTDNECVLISDWYKEFITIAAIDKVPQTIPAKYGQVRDSCIYRGDLYTAYEGWISKRSYKNGITGQEERLNPDIKDIRSMILNDSYVYLLSRSGCRIVEYNLNKNTTKEVVSNLPSPVYMSKINHEAGIMYGVSCRGTDSVNVYDDKWRLLFTFGGYGSADGQLSCPWGITSTTEGILVADYNNSRISQFSFNGKFMRHIITSKDGIGHPLAITYNKPYLWLTQPSPYTVKCFQICEKAVQ